MWCGEPRCTVHILSSVLKLEAIIIMIPFWGGELETKPEASLMLLNPQGIKDYTNEAGLGLWNVWTSFSRSVKCYKKNGLKIYILSMCTSTGSCMYRMWKYVYNHFVSHDDVTPMYDGFIIFLMMFSSLWFFNCKPYTFHYVFRFHDSRSRPPSPFHFSSFLTSQFYKTLKV